MERQSFKGFGGSTSKLVSKPGSPYHFSPVAAVAGAVDDAATVPQVRNWEASVTADVAPYVASGTKIGTGRLAGNKDWSGSYDAYGHTPANMPGEVFTFKGSIDGTNGITGPCIVDSVEISWDIEGGLPISHVVNFSGTGACTVGASAASDVTVPAVPTSIGCVLKTGTLVDAAVWTVLDDVRTMTLSITAANTEYVSSSTAGWKKRVAGNIDATMSASIYQDDFSNVPQANDVNGIQMFVDDTLYWEIRWMIFGELGGCRVDIESAAVVECTINASLCGFHAAAATPASCWIKTPTPVTFWTGV